MTRGRPLLAPLLAAATLASGACGVQSDTSPRDLAEDQRSLINLGAAGGAEATGADRIYLVGPGENRLLRSVPREEAPGFDLIKILLLGPNEAESAAQYTTVIPPDTELVSQPSRSGSTLFVDLTDEITQLTGASLTQALAQIVYTAAEIDGVERVALRVNGESFSWPTGNGGNTTGALSTYDFPLPGYVQSAQPGYPAVPTV